MNFISCALRRPGHESTSNKNKLRILITYTVCLLKYCRQRHVVYMRYPGGEFRFRPTALDVFMARCTIQGEKAA